MGTWLSPKHPPNEGAGKKKGGDQQPEHGRPPLDLNTVNDFNQPAVLRGPKYLGLGVACGHGPGWLFNVRFLNEYPGLYFDLKIVIGTGQIGDEFFDP